MDNQTLHQSVRLRWLKEMPSLQDETSQQLATNLSHHSTRPAANQIAALSSPGSIRPQPESLIGCDGRVNASNQREEANGSDSVETEVMEVSLPPLFAIQSHSLSQNILLLSNPAVPARQTAEVTFSPSSRSLPFYPYYKPRR